MITDHHGWLTVKCPDKVLRLCTVLPGYFAVTFRTSTINLRTKIIDLCFTCYLRLVYGSYTDGPVLIRNIYVNFAVIHGYLGVYRVNCTVLNHYL